MNQDLKNGLTYQLLHDLKNEVLYCYNNTLLQNNGNDIFKELFCKKLYNINYKEFERLRIKDKIINNHIGLFHEKVLQNALGYKKYTDISNQSETIFIQVKNKHNTMNSNSLKYLKIKMLELNINKPNSIIILGVINDLPNNKSDKVFIKNYNNIRRLSGKDLYKFVTNDENAFDDLIAFLSFYI